MKRSFAIAAIATMLVTQLAWANSNLNSSRSNVSRVTYDTTLASKPQITELLAALDKLGSADESTLKKWLAANFKRYGIDPVRVKTLIVMLPGPELKERSVIMLTNPADESRAREMTKAASKANKSD